MKFFLFLSLVAINLAQSLSAGEYAPPPYKAKLNLAILSYLVPSKQLENAIPQQFKLMSTAGHSPLVVLAAKYIDTWSESTGEKGVLYNEFSYVTLVTDKQSGKVGGYFLKLHLNEFQPTQIGRELYGFPKDISYVGESISSNSVSFDSWVLPSSSYQYGPEWYAPGLPQKNLGKFKMYFVNNSLTSASGVLIAWAQSQFSKIFKGAWFIRNGKEKVWADMSLNLSPTKFYPALLKNADFAYLREQGYLGVWQQKLPVSAFYAEDALLTIKEPLQF